MSESDRCSILFISQFFPPETGAAPTRLSELCPRWAKDGHDVTVLTSAPDYPEGEIYEGYDNRWIRHDTVDGVDVVTVKTIPASNSGFGLRALKFVWFMCIATVVGLRLDRHDVVLATAPQPLTGPAAWVVALLKRSKFVYEVRDLWPESITALSDVNDWFLRPLGWVIRFTYRRADQVVVVSTGFVPTLTDAGVDESDICFHPNGVSPEFFDHDGETWRIEDELVSDLHESFVVSYVGTIGRAHGLSVVLDAAEELEGMDDDVTFVLVGTGAEAEEIEAAARERGLDSVRFLGRRPKEQVPDVLALSDLALVHLRDIELFRSAIPSKTFEAMAAGVPILLGVRGEVERIVEEGDAGVVFDPENGEALADAIRELQADDERRAELGANGRRFVQESFAWDQIAASYSEDLQEVAEG